MPQRQCRFQLAWKKDYPVTSCPNATAFYCIPYRKTVSCAHQGKGDLERHCQTPTHRKFASALRKQPKIAAVLPPAEGRDPAVIRAEVLITNFVVQHNLSFAVADHLTKVWAWLIRIMRCNSVNTVNSRISSTLEPPHPPLNPGCPPL